MGPVLARGYVAERPAQRSLVGQSLEMTTQTASLVTMDEATDKTSVAAFVEDVLAGPGWELEAVRRRSSKLGPPDRYCAQRHTLMTKQEDERRVRLFPKWGMKPRAW